jgi:hypothetical protein
VNRKESKRACAERLRACIALGPARDFESAAHCERLVKLLIDAEQPGSGTSHDAAVLIERVHWWFGPAEFDDVEEERAARRDLIRLTAMLQHSVTESS